MSHDKIVEVGSIADEIGAFEVTHRYWFFANGLLRVSDRDAIIDKLNREIRMKKGQLAAAVEIEMEGCWFNYAYPLNFMLVTPSCLNVTMRGAIYTLKAGAEMPQGQSNTGPE